MFESFHRSNTNYGFVGKGTILRALKTLKCTCFCFAKKKKDDLVHLTVKVIIGRLCMGATFLAFLLTFRGHTCDFHHVLRGVELPKYALEYFYLREIQ